MKCPIGKKASSDLLNTCDSAFDAAYDFEAFIENCTKTCQYKADIEKENHELKVCCISAKARHGKDTAAAMMAEYLEKQGKKVLIIHFADLLKFICKQFFGWNGDKDEAGRTLLQHVGTDVVGAQYWAEFVVGFLKLFEKEWDFVLIPDCRYPIEHKTVEEAFDTVLLRVERHNFDNGLTDTQKAHPSETAMDDYCYDAVLYNDGSLGDFTDKVEWFVDNFLIN
jgi:hypothetical protein